MFRNAFQLSTGTWFLEKTAFLKMLIFSQIRISNKSCLKVLRQLFDSLEKTAIQLSTETFWRNNVLFLTDTKFYHLRTLTDAIVNIQRKLFRQFCRYGIQPIQINDCMKFLSYKELELFYHFWTLNEKSLEFLREKFVTVVEIVLACPSYVFLQFFLWKLCKRYLSFLYFDWFSFIFGWNFLGRFCKTALYVPEDFFEEKQLVLDFFSILQPFPDLSQHFLVLWRELCSSLVKSALFPPAQQIEGNFVLKKCINFQQISDFRVDRSGPSVAIFKNFVKIEFFVSQEIFWIKICLSSKKVFVSFLNFEQTIFRLSTRSFWERF